MLAPTASVRITAVSLTGNDALNVQQQQEDFLAAEVPLEISIEYGSLAHRKNMAIAVTMCSPGNEKELAAGFLYTEGIIHRYDDITDFHSPRLTRTDNKICVALSPEVNFDPVKLQRHFYTSSSCGICGKASIESIQQALPDNELRPLSINAALLPELPVKLRKAQQVFEHTGGLHAVACFDNDGHLLLLREDVGRHNALDKLVGAALLNDLLPLDRHIILLSGRASFELVQKAAMAGVQVLCAVGAPSSLAVETAEACGMSLIGFLREKRFNIYTHAERIKTN